MSDDNKVIAAAAAAAGNLTFHNSFHLMVSFQNVVAAAPGARLMSVTPTVNVSVNTTMLVGPATDAPLDTTSMRSV